MDYSGENSNFINSAATHSSVASVTADYVLFEDVTSTDTVRKCLLKYLPFPRSIYLSAPGSCKVKLHWTIGTSTYSSETTVTGCSGGGGGS